MKSHEYFMGLALQEAEAAYAEGEVPVGAILVIDGTVIAGAHNRCESLRDSTAHAELTAIREGTVKTGDWRLSKATVYVTKEPCVMCAGAMINAQLGKLIFGCKDDRYGAVNSRYQLLHDPGLNHNVRVISGVLKEECGRILKDFFRMRRAGGD